MSKGYPKNSTAILIKTITVHNAPPIKNINANARFVPLFRFSLYARQLKKPDKNNPRQRVRYPNHLISMLYHSTVCFSVKKMIKNVKAKSIATAILNLDDSNLIISLPIKTDLGCKVKKMIRLCLLKYCAELDLKQSAPLGRYQHQ